jgi:ABC-type antimicrobial peptide transport system permease subunit
LLEGSAADALSTPGSIAISRHMAANLFGSPSSAIGKTVRYENRRDFTVKAVFEDLPAHVSQKFDFLLNWEAFKEEKPWATSWGNSGPHALVMLRPDANPAQVEKKMARFLDAYSTGQDQRHYVRLGLQPFGDQYLYTRFINGYPTGGGIEYVRLFSLVALFILLIACINFMNLTTARSMKRAKEIGVRKVIGAGRGALIRQFLGEAILIAVLSAGLALLLVQMVLPSFNTLTGKQILLPYTQWSFWCLLIGLALVTGAFSGSYPAFFLSAFNPIRMLKGSLLSGVRTVWVRKGLVVFQFVLSIVLIISTILISRQVNYVQTANLGYDRENLLYIPIEGELINKLDVLLPEVRRTPGIAMVSPMSQEPTVIDNLDAGIDWPGKDPDSKPMFTQFAVGYDYSRTMKIRMVQGRDFSKDFPTDSIGYILNETALRQVGYKDPIGKPFTFWGKRGAIIGIIQDFHFQTLHNAIRPLVIRLGVGQHNFWTLLIRTQPGKTKEALAGLERLCKQLNPGFPFTYKFSDDIYGRLYLSEQIIGRLSIIFAILAIFISCLGLLGLSIFTAEQRTKEIGIRKVLGAGIASLIHLLSGEFLVLVGIAFLIAVPLAWWAMHQWLQQFAYQTNIPWWIFALSGILALLIALATVCWQALRAAIANPIKALRSE